MALIKPGAGVAVISGSIGGTVFSHNRFGAYIRNRTNPINPKSNRQSAIRILMMFLAEQWREAPMTDEIREAWQTYASSFNWSNRIAEGVTLLGFNAFIQCNAARMTAGFDFISAAPAALGLPPGDPEFVISNVDANAQTYDVAFDDGFDWCKEDGGALMISQGRPQSASHTFFGGPWRYDGRLIGETADPITSPLNARPIKGFPLVTGQKIWWEARITRADGRVSTKFRCVPTIVVAGA